MKRILLGGTFAGLVVFLVSAIDHLALPIGRMGVKTLPQEDLVLGAMSTAVKEPGLYIFPGMDFSKKPTEEQQKEYLARYLAGPTGLLVYSTGGVPPMQPRQLSTELLSDIMAAWIAAWVVSLTAPSFGRRVLLVALLGLFGWLSIVVSYWNWYRFPTAYVLGEAIDQVGSWLAGGFVLAAVFRGR